MASAPNASASDGLDSTPRDFAIVIGISRYQYLPPLQGPANDALAFSAWLGDPQGGRLAESDIRLLTSDQFASTESPRPALSDVDDAFGLIFQTDPQRGWKGRRLYIYAAGHGFSSQDRVGLALADASPELLRAFDVQAYADAVANSGSFDEVVLIVDCDRAADVLASLAAPSFTRRRAGPPAVFFSIFASTSGRHAFESVDPDSKDGQVRGHFTSAILEGLYGAAAGPDGRVDNETLSTYVRERLSELSATTGQNMAPEIRFGGARPIVFVESVSAESVAQVASSTQAKGSSAATATIGQAAPATAGQTSTPTADEAAATTAAETASATAAQTAPATAAHSMPGTGAQATSPPGAQTPSSPARTQPPDGPSAHIASDVWTVQDALGYRAYAYAIHRFMTHPNTHPPLTISIQAPWGGGKTSLMRMIQQELDPNGCETVIQGTDKPRGELKVGEALDEAKRWIAPDGAPARPVDAKPATNPAAAATTTPPTAPPESLPPVPPDAERHLLTVWFNAWKYESTREVWAGLVDAIMHQVAARLPVRERELFWLRLNLKRIDVDKIRQRVYDRVVRYWWRAMRWILGGVALFLAASVVLMLTTAPIIGWTVAGLTSAIGLVSGVVTFFRARIGVKEEPASVSLGDYLDVPDYAKELGFIHQIEADLRRVLESIPAQIDPKTNKQVRKPIVVFVDDLDRCSPAKVAQVIEAVNLFLGGEFPNCIFVIGMDAEMVAAALQAAHKDLVSALPRDAGIPVGWRFMDKFVQLPFIIPPMPSGGVERYTASLFSTGDGPPLAPYVQSELRNAVDRVRTLEEAASEADRILHVYPLDDEGKARLRETLRARAVQRTLSKGLDAFSDQSEDMRKVLAAGMPYFRGNPRELKRFVNAFRFNYFLWWAQCSQGLDAPKLDQLVRWTVLTMRWPEVVRWLRRSGGSDWTAAAAAESKSGAVPSRLKVMEDISGSSGDVASWQKEAAAKLRITQTDAPWLRDDDLLEFLNQEAKFPQGERLSSGAGLGLW